MTTNTAKLALAVALAGLFTCTARAQVAYVVSQPVAAYATVGTYYSYPSTVQAYAAPVAVAGYAAVSSAYAPVSSAYVPTYAAAPVSYGTVSYGTVSYPQLTYGSTAWYVAPQAAAMTVMPAGYTGVVYSSTW